MNKKVAQPELPSNRVFGYFFASIFGALGAYLGFKGLLTASTVLVLLAFVLATTAFFIASQSLMDEIWGAVEHHRQSNNNGVYLLFFIHTHGNCDASF